MDFQSAVDPEFATSVAVVVAGNMAAENHIFVTLMKVIGEN